MSEQHAAAKADAVEQFGQDFERLDVHVIERTRQRHRGRGAVAGARIGQHAGPGSGLQPVRKIPPQPGRSKALMQHDNGRGLIRRGADHAVFKLGSADAQQAGGGDGGHVTSI